MQWLRPIVKQEPRAAALAKVLIVEAAELNVTIRELKIAGDLAVKAFENAQELRGLAEFQSEAETAFD